MKNLMKETWKLLTFNQKNALIFQIVYRLITGPLYLLLLDRSLKLALRLAGYSYLTAGNIGPFLIKPWTILIFILILIVGIFFLAFETGCLLTLFQGAVYYRKLNLGEIIYGGLRKLADEIVKKNWRLGLLILVNYAVSNGYLIYRVLTHVKPINFMMQEIMKQTWGRVLLAAAVVLLLLVTVPGIYAFHSCMVDQKNFRDGYAGSRELLKTRFFRTMAVLCGGIAAVIALFHLVNGFCVLIVSIGMVVFTDNRMALAILPIVCDRIELVLIFITSMIMSLGNFSALTVQYYRYSNKAEREPGWNFETMSRKTSEGRAIGIGTAILAAVSLFILFDSVRNGSALVGDIMSPVQITAHRGSSLHAPENTMSALEQAVADLADFVEIDVQETADGAVVLGHDGTLRRVAGINRTIASYTLDDIKELDVGKWFSSDFADERIPTLQEVMEFCKGHVNMNIEIKNLGRDSPLPDKVVNLITEYQMKEQCVVTSTRLSYLTRVKELDPDIRTGYIISAAYGNYYSSDDIDFISIRSSFVTENLVAAAHEKGKGIHAWTVNTKSEMERMKMLGVDNIITDNPILAREIIYREEATENLLEYLRLVFK